jgi:hypothetical protein
MMTSILAAVIFFVSVAPISAATYIGTNTGAIPDGGSPTPTCGTPRDIQFLVTGFTGGFGSGSVSFTMTPQHSFVGDLQVSLIAPDLTSHLLFGRVGANSAGDVGDNANLEGTYTFNDLATNNIWAVAAANGSTNFDITNGSYRTQANGPFANDNPGPAFTSLNATFAPMNPANVNGTWTLRFLDCAAGDTGTVSAASLTINPTLAGDVVLGGRILTASGAGLKGAIVTISGGDLTAPRSMTTTTFGHYMFDDLSAGQSYVVSVSSRRYTFQTPAMLVNLEEDLAEVNFVANQ